MFTVKLWDQVMWKQMEIPFKLCCSIVNFRDTRYCSMGTYVLHGQLVSQLQRGPFCCQILRTIFVFIDNFKTNKISPEKTNRKQTENKQKLPKPRHPQPLPSPTKKILPVHTSHIVLLKHETATRNWNLDTITHLSFVCVVALQGSLIKAGAFWVYIYLWVN